MPDVFCLVEDVAAGRGPISDVERALSGGAQVNVTNGTSTPLICAVQAHHVGLVSLLLDSKASPDLPDPKGVGPLHIAVFEGRYDVIQQLIDARANVDTQDRHGQTPLFFAPDRSVCDQLGQAGADVNVTNHKGQSALHLAAHAGLNDSAQWLVQRVRPELINAQDKHGRTPVYCAAHSDLKSTVALLQEHGADLQARPNKSRSQGGVTKAISKKELEKRKGKDLAEQKSKRPAPIVAPLTQLDDDGQGFEVISPKRPLNEWKHIADQSLGADDEVVDVLAQTLSPGASGVPLSTKSGKSRSKTPKKYRKPRGGPPDFRSVPPETWASLQAACERRVKAPANVQPAPPDFRRAPAPFWDKLNATFARSRRKLLGTTLGQMSLGKSPDDLLSTSATFSMTATHCHASSNSFLATAVSMGGTATSIEEWCRSGSRVRKPKPPRRHDCDLRRVPADYWARLHGSFPCQARPRQADYKKAPVDLWSAIHGRFPLPENVAEALMSQVRPGPSDRRDVPPHVWQALHLRFDSYARRVMLPRDIRGVPAQTWAPLYLHFRCAKPPQGVKALPSEHWEGLHAAFRPLDVTLQPPNSRDSSTAVGDLSDFRSLKTTMDRPGSPPDYRALTPEVWARFYKPFGHEASTGPEDFQADPPDFRALPRAAWSQVYGLFGAAKAGVAAVGIHITGVDFVQLQPQQQAHLEKGLVDEMSRLLKIPVGAVRDLDGRPSRISLRGGSIDARLMICAPSSPAVTMASVGEAMAADASKQRFVESVKVVPGLLDVAYGPVGVTTTVVSPEQMASGSAAMPWEKPASSIQEPAAREADHSGTGLPAPDPIVVGPLDEDVRPISAEDLSEEARAKITEAQLKVRREANEKIAEAQRQVVQSEERAAAAEKKAAANAGAAVEAVKADAAKEITDLKMKLAESEGISKAHEREKARAARGQAAKDRKANRPKAVPKIKEDDCTCWRVSLAKREDMAKYGFAHSNAKLEFEKERGLTEEELAEKPFLQGANCLYVRKIAPGGLLEEYNSQHPDAEVRPSDRIMEVNGAKTVPEMKTALRADEVTFMVKRYPETWDVVLSRRDDMKKLGLRYEKPANRTLQELRITDVARVGLLEEMNHGFSQRGLHHNVVLKGMCLEQVNDAVGDTGKMVEELKKDQETVTLRIRRTDVLAGVKLKVQQKIALLTALGGMSKSRDLG